MSFRRQRVALLGRIVLALANIGSNKYGHGNRCLFLWVKRETCKLVRSRHCNGRALVSQPLGIPGVTGR